VLVQALHHRRWTTLGRATVSHRGFRVVFTAPSRPGALIVRAVLYRRHHRLGTSAAHRLVVRTRRPPHPPAAILGGAIAGWGANAHGELGGGFTGPPSASPVPVRGLHAIKAVASTYFTSYALLGDGTVRAWGGNDFGQLGAGARSKPSVEPVPVTGLSGVRAIAAGGDHAIALLSNGTVATWGGNSYGQMGNGTTLKGAEGTGSTVPLVVPHLSGVVAIAAGGGDDVALLSNGTLVAWGENKQGQLGDGTTSEKDIPTPVRGLSSVRAVAIGGVGSLGGHMLALLDDGTVRAIGGDEHGQLGDGTDTSTSSPVAVKGLTGVTAVSASVSHSMALLENGTVLAWGSNSKGELGLPPNGPETCGNPPVACSRTPVRAGVTGASAISAGFRFSLAVTAGKVFSWGWNEFGQLGNGTTTDSAAAAPVSGLGNAIAVAASERHSLALLGAGGPPASIEVTPGIGSLTVNWQASEGSELWRVTWRPVAHPAVKWAPYVHLAPATRSYTISGLSRQPYEVAVANRANGQRIITGTPSG
jgi:alpha-tubulin suppressor-like RCC1 family protein